MKLKISRKRGIRLYLNNRRYIKVHNVLLLILVCGLSWFLISNTVKALTHHCDCKSEIVELAFNNVVEEPSIEVQQEQVVEDNIIEEVEEVKIEEPVKPTYDGVCAQYYDLVNQYDWDTETMLAIMYAESNCRPNLDNTGLNKNGSVDYGLFQINSIHGYNKDDLMDPEFNVSVAYKIYKSQGLRAWSVYNSGKYLQYLNK